MHQVTVTPASVDRLFALWQLSQALIERLNLPVKSVLSSHSVDLIPRDASKLQLVRFLEEAQDAQPNQIVRVGDHGAWPGNDFELLAHPLGLSVDEVSPSPLNCWNFGKRAERGILVTCRYLDALRKSGDRSWRLRTTDAGWATG